MDLTIYRMMHSFRMPLFMFVSGFLMVYTSILRNTKDWKSFTKDKIRRLIVPFCVLSIVTFIPRSLMSTYADEPIDLNIETFLRSFLFTEDIIIPYYWFLQSSFTLLTITFLIFTLLKKLNLKNTHIFIILTAIYAVLPYIPFEATTLFSLQNTFNLAVFFGLGCCYALFYNKINAQVNWNSIYFLISTLITWALMFFITEDTNYSPICSMFGILMCISAAKILENKHITILDHLIGSNYIIFLLSWYFNIASQQILHHFIDMPWWVYTILSLISGIYVPWLFYRYMQKHKNSIASKFSKRFLGQSFNNISK